MAWAMSVISMTMSVVRIGAISITHSRSDSNAVRELRRAHMLVIEDVTGTDRIVLGAPMPSPKGMVRRMEQTGMMINDAIGEEQFGVGVDAEGRKSKGFDARPGGGGQSEPRADHDLCGAERQWEHTVAGPLCPRVDGDFDERKGEASDNFRDGCGESPEYVSFTLRGFER